MKVKVTKKAVKQNYSRIICIGYCDLQHLLKHLDPLWYSSGVYGWSCNYYLIDNIVISTGYNPIGNIHPSIELIRHYDDLAKNIFDTEKLNNLLNEFIREALK